MTPFIIHDLTDGFILGQRDQDIRRISAGIDDLRRLGVRRIKRVLLLLG